LPLSDQKKEKKKRSVKFYKDVLGKNGTLVIILDNKFYLGFFCGEFFPFWPQMLLEKLGIFFKM
jgi:hypothetical protein